MELCVFMFAEIMKKQPEIKKFMVIEEAFVPVIKTEFAGIEVIFSI